MMLFFFLMAPLPPAPNPYPLPNARTIQARAEVRAMEDQAVFDVLDRIAAEGFDGQEQ